MRRTRARLPLSELERGVLAGDRSVLARAVTLVESRRSDDRAIADELLANIWPHAGGAHRIGITGPPGVGKSTLLDSLGAMLLERDHSIAVLAVDPSSRVSGGSILGDKTRMPRLAAHPRAFVRPSPSGGSLGGVTRRTREAIALCEAARFDVVVVETVGVGQSETAVAEMVDSFVALVLPGSGDELQGIKKGVVELADILAVNKADGDNLPRARETQREHRAALRYLRPRVPDWRAPVVLVSGLTGDGLDSLWSALTEHRDTLARSGALEAKRRAQRGRWLWSMLEEHLLDELRAHPAVRRRLAVVERAVVDGRIPAGQGARELLAAFRAEG